MRTYKNNYKMTLAFGIAAFAMPAHALQSLDDAALSLVDAQDGMVLQLNFGPDSSSAPGVGLTLDRLYWEDQAGLVLGATTTGTNQAMRAYSRDIGLFGKGMGLGLSLDFGSYNGNAGVKLDATANIGTAYGRSFFICDNTGANWNDGCGSSLGGLTIQTSETTPLTFQLHTSDGLLNQSSMAYFRAGILNTNIYWNQAVNFAIPNSSTNNQLVFKNFNFNFAGFGYAFITNAGGFVFQTDCPVGGCTTLGQTGGVTLGRVQDPVYAGVTKTLPGLNLELMYKGDSGVPTDAAGYSLSSAKGLIHLGVSGEMTNASLSFRGTDAAGQLGDGSILGVAYAANGTPSTTPVLGTGGVALSLGAAFKRDGSNPVTLELGHAGTNAFAVQFGNTSPLQIRKGCVDKTCTGGSNSSVLNSDLATFTSGNVYVNLTESKKLLMPQNATLNGIAMGGSTLTTSSDYLVDVHGSTTSNPAMLVAAVRGMEFNSIARNSRFVVSNDVAHATVKNSGDMTGFYEDGKWVSTGNSWGLGLPFHNLNINTALYGATGGVGGTEERIGMGFALSTTGVNATGSRTTSILLIDGSPNLNDMACAGGCPSNYYMGLRNIDMYMAGMGSLGLNGDSTITAAKGINIKIDKFTLALATEVAAGYLPGSKMKTGSQYVLSDSFIRQDDVLFGLRLKMAGSANLVASPGGSTLLDNYPRLQGNLTLTGGGVQIVEPVDGTTIGFDNVTGNMSLDNYIRINADSVGFYAELSINPTRTQAGMLRFADVNLYPTSASPAQRLGEMVVTGGTLVSNLRITPF